MPDFAAAIQAIDAANAQDPNLRDGRPAELVYGERMSAALLRFAPDASELLRIAARGQHIERWTSPRSSYAEGKTGYFQWRNNLKQHHARRLGEIMSAAGYDEAACARVGALVRKEKLRTDAEAQTLEDVVCHVFLEHYGSEFVAKYDDDKSIDIIRKTWSKVSEPGRAAALKLPLTGRLAELVGRALAG